MTPEERLRRIDDILETVTPLPDGTFRSTHARHNLEGALIDMERTGKADEVCFRTIRRVCKQLADIEIIIEDFMGERDEKRTN